MVNALMSVVAAFGGGTIGVLTPDEINPYTANKNNSSGKAFITKENFKALKMLGDVMASGR